MTGKRAIALVTVAVAVLAGCGIRAQGGDVEVGRVTVTPAVSASPPGAGKRAVAASGDMKVTKLGFGTSKSTAGRYVHPVAIIHNGTADIATLEVSFAAVDATGKVLARTETSAPVARSGATVAVTTTVPLKEGEVAKVTAEVSIVHKESDDHPESSFVASGIRYRTGARGASVTGTITSRYVHDVKDAYVVAVCTNGSGQIVGGGEEYFTVSGGGATPVEVPVHGNGIKSCQLYPTLGGISTTG